MLYPTLHRLLVLMYAALPPLALLWAAQRVVRANRWDAALGLLITALSGLAFGTAVTVAAAAMAGGSIRAGQAAIAWYFATSFLLLLRGFRWVVREGAYRALRVPRNAAGVPVRRASPRALLAGALQLAVALVIGMPFVVAALVTARVKSVPVEDPRTLAGTEFVPVSFAASDGQGVAGWWVAAKPARRAATRDERARWGKRTILLCRGASDDARGMIGLAWLLASDGYNVLAFDLRGQGASDGQWTSFGDLERRDVLGALRWVKQTEPAAADRVFGVGLSTGGAAMLAAATDPSGAGEEIEAVAVYGTYADFPGLATDEAARRIPGTLGRAAARWIVPLVSAHAGTDLARFAPADLVSRLWPRPILIIQGRADQLISADQGEALCAGAVQPKQCYWPMADHAGAVASRSAARILRDFLQQARPLPAI